MNLAAAAAAGAPAETFAIGRISREITSAFPHILRYQETTTPNTVPWDLGHTANPGSARLGGRWSLLVDTTCRMSTFLPHTQLRGKITELRHLGVPSTSGHRLQKLQEGEEDQLTPHGEALSV